MLEPVGFSCDIPSLSKAGEPASVSVLHQPVSAPIACLVLGHGAGADMRHMHMEHLSQALARLQIATIRYNFPFMERGSRRTDSQEVCLATIEAIVELAQQTETTAPLFLGGHSFGGRMTSHYIAAQSQQGLSQVTGLVYVSFPLHPSKKPGVKRAEHLPDITLPQLFLSGDRDTLAALELLEPIVSALPSATLHLLDTADHGFKILKRSRQSTEDVYSEAARVTRDWMLAQQVKR